VACRLLTRSGHQDDLGNSNRRLVELRRVFLSGEMHMGRLLLSIAALLAGLSNAAFGQTLPPQRSRLAESYALA
jgi:hypothetical protein